MLENCKVVRAAIDITAVLFMVNALLNLLNPSFKDVIKNPLVILILVPVYLVYANTKSGVLTPSYFRKLIVKLATFCSQRSSPMNSRDRDSQVPVIKYVDETAVGFVWEKPELPEVCVNDNTWILKLIQGDTLIIFGLKPATCYDIQITSSGEDHKEVFYNFSSCTHTNTTAQLRRVDKHIVHQETIEFASDNLNMIKTKLRKLKKDFLKKKSLTRHELDTITTKIGSKKRTDERVAKRIQTLEEKVRRQKMELEYLENMISINDQNVNQEELKTYLETRKTELEKLLKDGKDRELKFSKSRSIVHSELMDEEQKLQRMQLEIENYMNMRDSIVRDYVNELKQKRLERKNYRIQIESDYKKAISGVSGLNSQPFAPPTLIPNL